MWQAQGVFAEHWWVCLLEVRNKVSAYSVRSIPHALHASYHEHNNPVYCLRTQHHPQKHDVRQLYVAQRGASAHLSVPMNVFLRPSNPARMSFFSRLSFLFCSLVSVRAFRLSARLRKDTDTHSRCHHLCRYAQKQCLVDSQVATQRTSSAS